jgi:hypothetical protein
MQPCLALSAFGPQHVSIMAFIIFFPMVAQFMEPSWLPLHLLIISTIFPKSAGVPLKPLQPALSLLPLVSSVSISDLLLFLMVNNVTH